MTNKTDRHHEDVLEEDEEYPFVLPILVYRLAAAPNAILKQIDPATLKAWSSRDLIFLILNLLEDEDEHLKTDLLDSFIGTSDSDYWPLHNGVEIDLLPYKTYGKIIDHDADTREDSGFSYPHDDSCVCAYCTWKGRTDPSRPTSRPKLRGIRLTESAAKSGLDEYRKLEKSLRIPADNDDDAPPL